MSASPSTAAPDRAATLIAVVRALLAPLDDGPVTTGGGQGQRAVALDGPAYTVGTTRSPNFLNALDEPARTVSSGGCDAGGGAEPFANAEYRRRLALALDTCAPTVKASGNDESVDVVRPSKRPFAILNRAVRNVERERERERV